MPDDQQESLETLINSAPVVVFRSRVTDLGELDELLDANDIRWRDIELGMGNPVNRMRYAALRKLTGHAHMPQVFINGQFVGGISQARDALNSSYGKGDPAPIPRIGVSLVYAGLIPFVGLAALLCWRITEPVTRLLVLYTAVIISFVGAVHWGRALTRKAPPNRYLWGALPAILAWALAALPVVSSLPLLATLLLVSWMLERSGTAASIPAWYQKVRMNSTIVSIACLLVAWVAILLHPRPPL